MSRQRRMTLPIKQGMKCTAKYLSTRRKNSEFLKIESKIYYTEENNLSTLLVRSASTTLENCRVQ